MPSRAAGEGATDLLGKEEEAGPQESSSALYMNKMFNTYNVNLKVWPHGQNVFPFNENFESLCLCFGATSPLYVFMYLFSQRQ